MSDMLRELLAVDSGKAQQFFLENLRDTVGARKHREEEIAYIASVLAHYTQVSRFGAESIPVLANLSEVFDYFIFQQYGLNDPEILEIGGSQILLFAGFFRDQMSRRHKVVWYDQVGQSFYYQASELTKNSSKRKLFVCLSETFPMWTLTCRDLSRNLRQNQLVLRFN